MTKQSEHERLFVDCFIAPERRDRWRALLSGRRRQKIVDEFNGDPATLCLGTVLIDVTHSHRSAEQVIASLVGDPLTYLMSGDSSLDQQLMSLSEALCQRNNSGHCISILPGVLAYWKCEAYKPTGCFILVSDPIMKNKIIRLIRSHKSS